jgi:hypothetical protein
MRCCNCGRGIFRLDASSTGWTHGPDGWQGIRCPGALTGALPVGRVARDDLALLVNVVLVLAADHELSADVRAATERWSRS